MRQDFTPTPEDGLLMQHFANAERRLDPLFNIVDKVYYSDQRRIIFGVGGELAEKLPGHSLKYVLTRDGKSLAKETGLCAKVEYGLKLQFKLTHLPTEQEGVFRKVPGVQTAYAPRFHNEVEGLFLLQYVEGSTMAEIDPSEISAQQALYWMLKLDETIQEMRKNGVIQADVKPENIIMRDRKRPVIIDFSAAYCDEDPIVLDLGTPPYVVKGTGFDRDQTALGMSIGNTLVPKLRKEFFSDVHTSERGGRMPKEYYERFVFAYCDAVQERFGELTSEYLLDILSRNQTGVVSTKSQQIIDQVRRTVGDEDIAYALQQNPSLSGLEDSPTTKIGGTTFILDPQDQPVQQ